MTKIVIKNYGYRYYNARLIVLVQKNRGLWKLQNQLVYLHLLNQGYQMKFQQFRLGKLVLRITIEIFNSIFALVKSGDEGDWLAGFLAKLYLIINFDQQREDAEDYLKLLK